MALLPWLLYNILLIVKPLNLLMFSKPHLQTLLSPRLLDLYDISNSVVVIIDVFRATSTIAAALHNGAKKVIPVSGVQECIQLGRQLSAVTAGERDGKVIEGLQHGNSPIEYQRSFIGGKTLVLTTTNGTRLLHMALNKGAQSVITGSFPNLHAVCEYIVSSGKDALLACSGWKDRFNIEDTMFAGAVINEVKSHFTIHCEMYNLHKHGMHSFIRKTTHWHRLASYGLEADLDFCLVPNVANALPVYKNHALVNELAPVKSLVER